MTARIVKEIPLKYRSVTPSRPIRVCAYVRVSTSHDEQLHSLHSQTDYYEHRSFYVSIPKVVRQFLPEELTFNVSI